MLLSDHKLKMPNLSFLIKINYSLINKLPKVQITQNFDSVRFKDELKYVLVKEKITSCIKFDEMFLRILSQHAPLKSKLHRANHASYISKPLKKAIVNRSYLENLYFKRRTDHSLRNYKKQKNYCSRLHKKERKNFYVQNLIEP